ncbi:hypothetical protein PENSUB_1380 [Penicillium subrubescens]|uniref:Uncharacterized protein n=1 Tax=Penicillium subrubescens TaxID=1316194 RepID=A0A1Q5UKE3_9EURO|nr:hypothetical protein PENSUB_1380 [Penicillium subrubescens]
MLGAEYALSSESAEQDLSSEEANGVRLQIDQATYDRLRWEYVFLTTALPFFVPRELEMITKLAAGWALVPQPGESRTSADPRQDSPKASDN